MALNSNIEGHLSLQFDLMCWQLHTCHMFYFCLKYDVSEDANVRSILETILDSATTNWDAKLYIRETRYLMIFRVWDDDLAIQIKLAHSEDITQRNPESIVEFNPLSPKEVESLLLKHVLYYAPRDTSKFNVLHKALNDMFP